MILKKIWKGVWETKHTALHYVEIHSTKPRIFFDGDCGKWICISLVTLKEIHKGSIGAQARKTGCGDTPEEAYIQWSEAFERIIE